MPINYETRMSAPLRVNGYISIVDLLRKKFEFDVMETSRIDEWVEDGNGPNGWKAYTHAQIYKNNQHIGDIVGVSVFALVVYEGFPKEALEAIVQSDHLTRELTIPKGKPIEIDVGFK